MDIHQLKSFVAVARAGGVGRASETLHLSQPAVSAHIKAMEELLGLVLFERTPRGMVLTKDGERLLVQAERAIGAHRAFLDEAARMKGRLGGPLRLGAASGADAAALGRLVSVLAERCPEVDLTLSHTGSEEFLDALTSGALDAGFYNEAGAPDASLSVIEIARFGVYVAAAPALARTLGLEPPETLASPDALDWSAIAAAPWISPGPSACCGRIAEQLFQHHGVRPARIIRVEREDVGRTLITGGAGVGLLHADAALAAQAAGEAILLSEARPAVRVLFAHLARRAGDPLIDAVGAILRAEFLA